MQLITNRNHWEETFFQFFGTLDSKHPNFRKEQLTVSSWTEGGGGLVILRLK